MVLSPQIFLPSAMLMAIIFAEMKRFLAQIVFDCETLGQMISKRSEFHFGTEIALCDSNMARRKNILLVDDDIALREALVNALESENYHVVPAANVEEAVREFLKTPIDVALLDLNLGDECGWDIFQRLMEIRPSLSAIIMSAEPGKFAHPSAPAAKALLEKPLNLPVLFNILNRFASAPAESRFLAAETSAIG